MSFCRETLVRSRDLALRAEIQLETAGGEVLEAGRG